MGGGSLDPDYLVADALAFLAIDTERLRRFLDVTGLEPDTIRAAAEGPGFNDAVLDYLLADEDLLLEVAEHLEIPPDLIAATREATTPRKAAHPPSNLRLIGHNEIARRFGLVFAGKD